MYMLQWTALSHMYVDNTMGLTSGIYVARKCVGRWEVVVEEVKGGLDKNKMYLCTKRKD